jgi:hypothetical protein
MKRTATATLALLFWFAIGLQFELALARDAARGVGPASTALTFLMFFTNTTGLGIALVLTLAALNPDPRRIWNAPSVLTALAMFIVIVAVVYAALLQGQWRPEGWRLVVDRLLHLVLPILYVIWWAVFVPKGRLRWYHPLVWQVYPALYMTYIMLRGEVTGRYPYPFLNVTRLGSDGVVLNGLGLLAAMLATSYLFMAVDRALRRHPAKVVEPA